jgi:hypothetical protein
MDVGARSRCFDGSDGSNVSYEVKKLHALGIESAQYYVNATAVDSAAFDAPLDSFGQRDHDR